ncbi:MAG: glycoside hydrolase family 13 protein [Anaerolineae bacterium]|nr:glycoside hydrolase family 13 protein [Anaerolineae bacterium]
MTVPYWVQDAIFYQIFPDRFANGDPTNNPANIAEWGAGPTLYNFMGGDLRGITQKLDYLLDLGVNALYLNPIFLSPSNHRYNTSDYYTIDPKLGKRKDFDTLLNAAHSNGMRVVIDGVFNHCSRGFFAFADLLENGEHSAYKDWFHVKGFPLNAYTHGDAENYAAWWNFKSLPKFNTDNPVVRDYIYDIAKYWMEAGADGWRLDVPNEIDSDAFWAGFRQIVRGANPDAYILGEIWEVDPRWVDDNHFDGLMHYPVRDALIETLNSQINATQFGDKVESLFNAYPQENVRAMYVPLGSHDTKRIHHKLGGDLDKIKLAFLFQFAYPGAPAIYYGDEVGVDGDKDPDCRRAFPWDKSEWKGNLRDWVQELIGLRKRIPAMRRGEYIRLLAEEKGYAFARKLGTEKVVVAMNLSENAETLRIPVGNLLKDGDELRSLLNHNRFGVREGFVEIKLDAWSGVWLK